MFGSKSWKENEGTVFHVSWDEREKDKMFCGSGP